MISIDDFQNVEMCVGKILSAEKVPETDKLLRLSVDFGMKDAPRPEVVAGEGSAVSQSAPDVRQVVSGIAMHFPDPSVLVGKKCLFVTNLEPRTIRGLESQAMILTASTGESFSLFEPGDAIEAGAKAR